MSQTNLVYEEMLDVFTDVTKDYMSEAIAGLAWVFTNMDMSPAERCVIADILKQVQAADFEIDCLRERRKKLREFNLSHDLLS